MTTQDFSEYQGHAVRLEYEQVHYGEFAVTNWLLFIDRELLYLGQDSKFVTRVLGQDFAGFIHDAFERAGINSSGDDLLAGEFERELLRASLGFGLVQALDDKFASEGQDFFEVLPSLEPWSLSTS